MAPERTRPPPGKMVYAPDSSPVSTDKAMRNVADSRLGKVMGSQMSFGSSFTKNIPRSESSSASRGSPEARPKLSLDKYKFNDNGASKPRVPQNAASQQRRKSPITVIDDSSDLSDASSAEERPQKKRKFKRGKQPSPESSPQKKPPASSETISIPSSSSESEHESWDRKVTRLHALFRPDISRDQVEAVLRTSKTIPEAMSALEGKRKKLLETRRDGSETISARSTPSTASASVASTMQRSSSLATSSQASRPSPMPKLANSAAAKPRPQAAPQPKRRESPQVISDDGYSSANSDAREAKRAEAAVEWFNEVNEATLIETIGCSPAQARIIDGLRPFDSADDVERRLKSTKGVTAKLFTDYTEVLASFNEVDKVLKRCEQRGRRLEQACSPEAVENDPCHLKGKPKNMAEDVVLKDYQLDGVNWLSLRYRNDTSCILADDMGTGKTCQVITFLCDLKQRKVAGTSLVVAPSSTIENWSRELKKFGPNLEFLVFAGDQAGRRELRYQIEDEPDRYDVIVTSYNSATSATDMKFFKKFGFNACVYDEGHQLKNQNTSNYRTLMQVRAKWRLLLTGTPLQNNLLELMSLLKFIMPADFKNATDALETIFKGKSGAKDSQLSKSRVDRAKRMMQPFVLRRIKDKVLTLPPKTIHVDYCEMTPHQQKIYRKLLARTRLELLEQDEESGKAAPKKKKDQSSNILMRLRKAAIHPMMFRTIFTADKINALVKDYVKEPQHMDENMQHLREDFAINSDAELSQLAGQYPHTRKHQVDGSAWLNSGKIKALDRWIKKIKAQGEKLVIFSQFEMALFMLMSALDELGYKWIAFSGRTKVEERQGVIDEFQTNPDITVFLLTTKAGGVGVNLTAANWVIMLDQDFNPQNDKQAEDRCWRIGQDKEVHVVKLVSKGTIDEDILALGQRKLELAARVSGMENGAQSSSSGKQATGQDGDAEAAAITELDMDDGKQQDATAQTLMSKLRSKAQESPKKGSAGREEGKDRAGARDDADGEADDDDDDDIEILDG